MIAKGSFVNVNGDTIEVVILTQSDRSTVVTIGADGSGILFSDDPVEVSDESNDTFDVLLRKSCTVRLLCRNMVPEFFCTSCRDAVVNVSKNGACVFAGFIEPQTFSQPYNDIYDEVELNCVDALSALHYSKYANIGALGTSYILSIQQATQRSFIDILLDVLKGATDGMSIEGETVHLWYDGSKAISSDESHRYTVFADMSINELLFFGDSEDDVWQLDAVVEAVLKYLNLHITQEGADFFIFSWETIRADTAQIEWHDLMSERVATTPHAVTLLTSENAAGCDTTISMCETFNQLLLTCNIQKIEDVIESPLDSNSLYSPYTYYQKYLTEISAEGDGVKAADAFWCLTHDMATTYKKGYVTDWYIQLMNNSKWSFHANGNSTLNIVDYFTSSGTRQHGLPMYLGKNPGAAIISIGSDRRSTATNDNSPTSKISMDNWLVVSVNGNEKDKEGQEYPSESSILKNIPCAVYNGGKSGGTFSPSDDSITNYIVISGSVVLNPIIKVSDTFGVLDSMSALDFTTKYLHIPGEKAVSFSSGKRYYTRKYWAADTPYSDPVCVTRDETGWYPFPSDSPQLYEFKYSAVGDSSDHINKIAVLSCMLVIGNKCVMEKTPDNSLGDVDSNGNEIPYTDNPEEAYRNFVWREFKERDLCADDAEYYSQSFTIGFDPKIGDKLIGVEYSMQKTFSSRLGIDAEGIAIAVRKGDKISGDVRFSILGPVNIVWDEITRRHPTWFRHTKWGSKSVALMAHVSSIMLKQLEVKVYTDNAHVNNYESDKDVVYMSDTKEQFVNRKDDLEFKISSAFTSDECKKLGVPNTINMSTPLSKETGVGVLRIYDYNFNAEAKPEQMYVDSYYREWHIPRVTMNHDILDADTVVHRFGRYRMEAMDRVFYVQGMGRNLIAGSVSLNLKEAGND